MLSVRSDILNMFVNPMNVLNLLLATFQTMYLPTTEVNRQEIILKESIQKILLDSIWDFNTLEVSEESTLGFVDDFSGTDAEYVEDAEDWSEEGVAGPSSSVCPSPVNDEIPFDYKKRAVEYWRSGKKAISSFLLYKSHLRDLLILVN